MSVVVVFVVLAVVAVMAVAIIIVATRRPKDAVDSFRRQIDALSPEARRGVVDQVQHAAGRGDGAADVPGSEPSEQTADDTGEGGDEDGARGA